MSDHSLWLYLSASSVNRVLLTKSMRLLCCWFVYATYFSRPFRSICYRCGSVQVPCWEEPGFGTSPETTGVHVYPRMQRGWNVCSGPSRLLIRVTSCWTFCWVYSLIQKPAHVYTLLSSLSMMYVSASAGPVSHSDRLLLVCHKWRQASERLLCAQQDPGVFRYWWENVLKTCGWNVQSLIISKLFSHIRLLVR